LKIEATQENKIIVELTESDMLELGITYDQMDYSNIETRRVIWTLLDRARQTLGRDIDPSGKMLIEALPGLRGGCVIYFTVLEGDMRPCGSKSLVQVKKESAVATYEFASLDALMDCAEAIRHSGACLPKSDLYVCGGRYRLSVFAECPAACDPQACDRPFCGSQFTGDWRAPELRRFFGEYGGERLDGRMFFEFTKEHWRILAEGNALEKLSLMN